MLAKIVYILGIIVAVWCVLDIFKKKNLNFLLKIILAAIVLATSWVGFIVYYIFRNKI